MNYTESDTHTLALMNRGNWEVLEERDDDTVEPNVYVFKNSTQKERKRVAKNARLEEQLVKFCIENWDNNFIRQSNWQDHKKPALIQAELTGLAQPFLEPDAGHNRLPIFRGGLHVLPGKSSSSNSSSLCDMPQHLLF